MEQILINLREESLLLLQDFGINGFWGRVTQSILTLIIIITFAWITNKITTIIMRNLASIIIGKTKGNWKEALLKNKVFSKLSNFIPPIVISIFYEIIYSTDLRYIIELFIGTYFIIVFLIFANSLIDAIKDIYKDSEGELGHPVLYLQLIKVTLFSLGIIAIIAIFANKNFIDMLKGLGTMITVILVVYKDTIMGFVAGVQLSANKMLKIGDWVSLPKDNADGTVVEISLNTVKIQNWDRTITTIPTYKLMSESFTNWRGMEESDGRRIKRHIKIDMNSVRFLSYEDIERLGKFKLLEEYISKKTAELDKTNKKEKEYVNQRKISNLGTFKKYIENYLLSTGYVNTDMTFMVRQLQPSETGIPIEIYFFSKEKSLTKYEQIQAEIFEHIISIIPLFNLRVYQKLSDSSLFKIDDIKQ